MDDIQKNDEQKSEINGENNELNKCQKERDEYLDGWKRAKADLINYKKDEMKRFEMMAKFSQEAIIKDLITVLDSFDLALAALEKEGKVEKGIYLIRAQLEDILKQNGLERVIISTGQPFDPSLQEAIVSVDSDKPSGAIVEEVERGYLLHGKLVRPARVKISK
ncbi:MAG: nucleotide exchange factor GrpE [Patescibacteria group bacterium]|nr:nucleotide exchange factor GrpE [Patescibacteria group bacterium]